MINPNGVNPNEAPDGAIAVPYTSCSECMYFDEESGCTLASLSRFVSCTGGARRDNANVHYRPISQIDITDPQSPVVNVDARADAETQREMIQFHHRCLCQELGREPTMLETCQSWVDNGWAALYRQHFRVVSKRDDLTKGM